MRKIEFNELKLKNRNGEETFYQSYLKNLPDNIKSDNTFHIPVKQYEIFYLNILGGKLILLNKDYIDKDTTDSELFFDYSIAYKVYNLMLDIEDGIEDEKNEFNELYKEERLQKNNEIEPYIKPQVIENNKNKDYTNLRKYIKYSIILYIEYSNINT